MNYEEYEKYHKNDENYKDYINKTFITKEQLNNLIRKDTCLEYIKGYEEEKYLQDVLFRKIEDKKIKDTYNLSKEIYDYIDNCVYDIYEDKDILIDYINSKIIIMENQLSKNIFTNKEGRRENKAKKGRLEKYKRSRAIENMIIPYLELNKEVDIIEIQEQNECSFRNYIRNKGKFINELTLAPHILTFFVLCEKRKYSKLGTKLNRSIIKNNWNEYSILDLFIFYNELYKFILKSEQKLYDDKKELDTYIEYFDIGYNLFEDQFKGDRYLFILENLNKYKINLDYKLNLYLGIALMIDDIELSKKEIKRIMEYSYLKQDDKVEEIVYKILAYNKFVYINIEGIIEELICKRSFEVINNKKGTSEINSFTKRYHSLIESYDSLNRIFILTEISDEVFYKLKLCDDFLSNEGVLEYINEEKAKDINSKLNAKKIFVKDSGILYLILGGFIQYTKD